jgi:hypothetical protein
MERHNLLDTMVRIKHPGAADAIIDSLKQQSKSVHGGYYWYWYGEIITALPGASSPSLRRSCRRCPKKWLIT